MTFIPNWEEFEKSAEMLYIHDPLNTRYSIKYSHSKGVFLVKITDNKKILFYIHKMQDESERFLWEVHCGFRPGIKCFLMSCCFFFVDLEEAFDECLQYKTEVQQDVRKIDKFISNLMRHMASNDN